MRIYNSRLEAQFTQPDPIGLAGGLNLYGYANGDPVNHSDPYGLMADCDDKPCPVFFLGFGGSVAAAFGFNASGGFTYSKGEGLGIYFSRGASSGIDLGLAVEFGTAESRSAFDGPAAEACVGGGAAALAGTACVAGATDDQGRIDGGIVTFRVGGGLWPASATGGLTQTGSFTWGDLRRVRESSEVREGGEPY